MTDEEISKMQQLSNELMVQVKMLEKQIGNLINESKVTSVEIHAQSLGEALDDLDRQHRFLTHLQVANAILQIGQYSYTVVLKPKFENEIELMKWLNAFGEKRMLYCTGLLTVSTEEQIVFVTYHYDMQQ